MKGKVKITPFENKFIVTCGEDSFVEDSKEEANIRKAELEKEIISQFSLKKSSGNKEKRVTGNKEKSVEIDIEIRVELCVDLILQGYTYHEIVTQLVNEHEVTPNAAYNYITKAQNEIKKNNVSNVEDMVLSHSNRWENLYKKFLQLDSHKLAIKCLQYKEKINGLYLDQKSIVFNQIEMEDEINPYDTSKLTNDEYNRMRILLKKVLVK